MTTQDFWKSIKEIIDEDFTEQGLATLDNYAEQFITGRIVYKRFSQREQYGCAQGGATHVIASLLAAAEIDPNCITAPLGSFKREQQCAEAQTERIEAWARKTGCWIEDADTVLNSQFGELIAEGGEAQVYDHGSVLIKTIGLDYYVQPIFALDRISLHNAWFPETRLNVLGFGKTSDNRFVIIVEQPYIQGTQMSEIEIRNFAESLGFTLRNAGNWTYATPETYLSDLHDENVIKSAEGNIFVIDCDIRINTPELREGGIRELSSEIVFV